MKRTTSDSEEMPAHHYPSSQGLDAGSPFIQSGAWGDFISAVLSASVTIDARRAARQQAQQTDESSTQQTANVSAPKQSKCLTGLARAHQAFGNPTQAQSTMGTDDTGIIPHCAPAAK